jgi:hypothetical protein
MLLVRDGARQAKHHDPPATVRGRSLPEGSPGISWGAGPTRAPLAQARYQPGHGSLPDPKWQAGPRAGREAGVLNGPRHERRDRVCPQWGIPFAQPTTVYCGVTSAGSARFHAGVDSLAAQEAAGWRELLAASRRGFTCSPESRPAASGERQGGGRGLKPGPSGPAPHWTSRSPCPILPPAPLRRTGAHGSGSGAAGRSG